MPELKFQLSKRKSSKNKEDSSKDPDNVNENKMKEKDEQVRLVDYDQNSVIAYLARKFPETYNITHRLIHEIKLKFPDFKPSSFLDYGAGLSPTGHAVFENFQSIEMLFAIEPNMYMRKLGKYMSKDIEQFSWGESIHETNFLGKNKKFDFINCSFVLEEVSSPEERKLIIETLFERTSDNGFITIVLPGSPMGFRFLNDIREMVIKKERSELNIIAPCPHHLECPLARNARTWCRFEQSWPRYPTNILPKLSNEQTLINSRFCYLTIKKGSVITSLDQVKTLQDESFFWERIIKPTKKKGGHNIVTLCNSKGRIEKRITARSHEPEFGYRESKFMRWGDLWKFPLRIPNKFRKEEKSSKKLF
jgi:ribosomal protein RSM22 (predicted rRNA methylase)